MEMENNYKIDLVGLGFKARVRFGFEVRLS